MQIRILQIERQWLASDGADWDGTGCRSITRHKFVGFPCQVRFQGRSSGEWREPPSPRRPFHFIGKDESERGNGDPVVPFLFSLQGDDGEGANVDVGGFTSFGRMARTSRRPATMSDHPRKRTSR